MYLCFLCTSLYLDESVYHGGHRGSSIFQTGWTMPRTWPSSTWLPVMFPINHCIMCVCARRGGSFCRHSKERFKFLATLIKASHYYTNKQSECIPKSIRWSIWVQWGRVSEGQSTTKPSGSLLTPKESRWALCVWFVITVAQKSIHKNFYLICRITSTNLTVLHWDFMWHTNRM